MASRWRPIKSDDEDDKNTSPHRRFSTGTLVEQDVPDPPPPEIHGTSASHTKRKSDTTDSIWSSLSTEKSGIISDFQTVFGKGSNDGGVWIHKKSNQLYKLLKRTVFRILGSATFVISIILLFVLFSRYSVMDKTQEYTFNTFSLLLFLLFGIHLLLAFKELAEMARWRILAGDAYKLKDIDLILGLGSLRSTVKLGLRSLSHGQPGTQWLLKAALAFGWVAFLCLLNVAIALLGLTYSLDTADNFGMRPGMVSIPNLKHFYPNNDTANFAAITSDGGDLSTESFMANLYGITSFSYKKGNVSDDIPQSEYWLEQYNNGSWKYHFHDLDYYGGLNVRTNRFITTNQTCSSYKIMNITSDMETFWYFDPATNKYYDETLQELLANFTTYALRPAYDCDRCRSVYAVQLTSAAQNWNNNTEGDIGYFFTCDVEVSPIFNAKLDNHILSDRQARIAAGAIANRGWVDGNGWSYFHYRDSVGAGSYIFGNSTAMESLLSQFAVGVIAALDQLNPRDFVFDSDRPFQGNKLNVIWWAFYSLLGCLLGAQIIFSIIALWFSNSVVVKDGSYISVARLLRRMLLPSINKPSRNVLIFKYLSTSCT
ncbi:hypothetical protein TWF694_007152 [Orbilia ellipsospora]|uniref:Uncharacterized protein n=1 Tax=Orbilia ellipsospora TaxID=2528407 RepID=A0AAV9XJJ4_9PEZI